MKIFVKDTQVFGMVENDEDLKILLKARDSKATNSNTDAPEVKTSTRRPYTKRITPRRHMTWTKEELAIIKEDGMVSMSKPELKKLAKKVGRSVNAVRIIRNKIRKEDRKENQEKFKALRKTSKQELIHRPWTAEESQMVVETVEENPDITKSKLFERLSKVLGRSVGSINVRYYQLRQPFKKENENENKMVQIPINFEE